jgi:hypothetical protein
LFLRDPLVGKLFKQLPQIFVRFRRHFVRVKSDIRSYQNVVSIFHLQRKTVRTKRRDVHDAARGRLIAEIENPRCLRIHLGMNGHDHPTPFGFVVPNQCGLDGLCIERERLRAITTFQKFPQARKRSGNRIIAKRTKYILLLAWHSYVLRAVDLGRVAGALEVSVVAKVRSGQREFEPDPVPAVYSVREDLAMERNDKMRRDMVVGVNSPVYAGREGCLTCCKTQAHWGKFLMTVIP